MRLTIFGFAAATLLASTALAGGLGEMTDAERATFRAEIRAYLLDNPEVLVEAMTELEQRQQVAEAEADRKMLVDYNAEIFEDPSSWAGGNLQGDITVVEFVDYRCSYCRRAHAEVKELVALDGNIRFVLKEYPILEGSETYSRFAIAVLQLAGPEAYEKAHDALMVFRGEPVAENFARLAQELGLDSDAILAHMPSEAVTNVIRSNHDLGSRMRVNGTPTFVVDGTLVRGYLPLSAMQQIVAGQREG